MVFRRRTPEQRAESRERLRSKLEEARQAKDKARQVKDDQQTKVLVEMLVHDESVVDLFKTAEALMKKHVLFTSKRLLVASVHDPSSAESIPYRSITRFTASNFITKDVTLAVDGRRDDLELSFSTADERDRVVGILNERVL